MPVYSNHSVRIYKPGDGAPKIRIMIMVVIFNRYVQIVLIQLFSLCTSQENPPIDALSKTDKRLD